MADIEAAVEFYTALFDTTPAGRRPGYANFAVVDPPLKLVLFENSEATGTRYHLGVEREPRTLRHGRRRVKRTPAVEGRRAR